MDFYKKLSLKTQFILIIQVINLLTIGLGLAGIVIYNLRNFKNDLLSLTELNALHIGESIIVPLTFDDKKNLAKLRTAIPAILNVELYKEGKLFYAYNYRDSIYYKPQYHEQRYYQFEASNNILHYFLPITEQNKVFGTVYLRVSTISLEIKKQNLLYTISALYFVLLILSFILTNYLQSIITEPIMRLAKITNQISQNEDYSIIVHTNRRDEIGILYKGFTSMLKQIHAKELAQAQTAKQIRHYVKELERNNQELAEFNYAASHDLREPLRTLISYCELLKEDIGDQLNESAQEDIEFIVNAANRMNTLILDLLQLSRAGRTEFFVEDVDLNQCMSIVVSDLKIAIAETNGTVLWGGLPVIKGDKTHIIRLLQNLVNNALKFHRDVPPVIEISATPIENHWQIIVSDNGIGIEEKYLLQIFLPFKRLHGLTKYQGTGIGLAICKKIAERHNGTIIAESEPGIGSKFIITIPQVIIYN